MEEEINYKRTEKNSFLLLSTSLVTLGLVSIVASIFCFIITSTWFSMLEEIKAESTAAYDVFSNIACFCLFIGIALVIITIVCACAVWGIWVNHYSKLRLSKKIERIDATFEEMNKITCKICGNKVEKSNMFCPKCGNNLFEQNKKDT